MDIYDYLKKDHDRVTALFEQFKKAPGKRKADIALLIADELLTHAKSEEKTFYKAMDNAIGVMDETSHGRKEHDEIEAIIAAFDGKDLSEKSLTTKIEKLQELVDHHVKEEEGKIFRNAKKILTIEQSFAIKELMHDLKHQHLLQRQSKRARK